ncbi:SCP-2 sterol transfer family protein [Mesobacillus persicus]|uniref:SCP-2 sterol transfer family protein n=1 Tax=Mesobacillus persicus TaxID=930146 RepID=A0A1H7ZWP8_9BACI|nr:SCP2 sterol-binding domain-containing protein [Mesobacillus persicus]SEM62656.1 SCP-2 sterol transfer family protein [Mesobacillus persicus]
MDKKIVHSVENMGNKQHVIKLLNHQKLEVAIETEKENFGLVIDDGIISLTSGVPGGSPSVRIQGKTDVIHSLLEGNIKLREGARYEKFHISGSFRNQLMLESLFFLTGKSSY